MACFHPMLAYKRAIDGKVVIVGAPTQERLQCLEGRSTFELPCGKCIGCRQVRVRSWALRCMHEAQMHSEPSSFVTLTYDGKDVDPSLRYYDFQMFMRRLKYRFGVHTRFFMSGEYGHANFRPHFHAILFGRSFSDRKPCGKDLFRSPLLESVWTAGFSSVGECTRQSAAYVASYCFKKASGELAERRYRRLDERTGELIFVEPEFARMSLKPGIGYSWFQKYWKDVFEARDGVVCNGKVVPSPRYYMDLLADIDPDRFDSVDFDRVMNAGKFAQDRTPERLYDRELCALASNNRKRRQL